MFPCLWETNQEKWHCSATVSGMPGSPRALSAEAFAPREQAEHSPHMCESNSILTQRQPPCGKNLGKPMPNMKMDVSP